MCFDTIFGIDTDHVFAYETPKIVRILDRRLGLLYYFLVGIVCLYVIGYQILYANHHFQMLDVYGTGRITLQHPTRLCNPKDANCLSNFHSLLDLPYCKQSAGNSTLVEPKRRRDCEFMDRNTMVPFGMLGDHVFVPTAIETRVDKQGCVPNKENGFNCENAYVIDPASNVKVFVAEPERFTVLIQTSYHRRQLDGNNAQLQGFYQECLEEGGEANTTNLFGVELPQVPDMARIHTKLKSVIQPMTCKGTLVRRPITCLHSGECLFHEERAWQEKSFLQQSRGRTPAKEMVTSEAPELSDKAVFADGQSSGQHHRGGGPAHVELSVEAARGTEAAKPQVDKWSTPPVFSIRGGDVFHVSKLLDLAALSLDSTFNSDGESLREAGTAIEVAVYYQNLVPFWSSLGYRDVRYSYKVTQRALEEMKTELVSNEQPLDFPKERAMENRHGIYILVKVGGTFGFFSTTYFLVMLTTSIGLFAAAALATDKIAIYVMEQGDRYYADKYSITKDYSNDDNFRIFGVRSMPNIPNMQVP